MNKKSVCPNCNGTGIQPKQPKQNKNVYCSHCHGNGNDTWLDFLEFSNKHRYKPVQDQEIVR